MEDLLSRLGEHWDHLLARQNGPFGFRFVLQPVMSVLFAIRDGRKDAQAGRPPYFKTVLLGNGDRWALLKEGLAAVSRVLVFGLIVDGIYQAIVFHWFYPGEALLMALFLAFLPYLLVRGPANRLARRRPRPMATPPAEREKEKESTRL